MGAPIPSQIADKLRGRRFNSFDDFRKVFWKEVGSDPELSKQFTRANAVNVPKGYSPYTIPEEQAGGREVFEIHHVKSINEGGEVYNMDNLRILTPKRHIKIHANKGEKWDEFKK